MILSIPTSELRDAVAGLTRMALTKTCLPILRGICFEAIAGEVTARATDLESSVSRRFHLAECQGDGAFVLDRDDLKTLVQGSKTVSFDCRSKDQVAVTLLSGDQSVVRHLSTLDPEEFPVRLPEISTDPVPSLLESYRRLVPFASSDSSRQILCGVCVDGAGKIQSKACMVATDGRRLTARNSLSMPFSEIIVLPVVKFLQWNKLTADAGIGIAHSDAGTRLAITSGPWTFQTRGLAGTFPNWRQVVPSEPGEHRVTVSEEDAERLSSMLPTLSGCEAVTFHVNGEGKLSLSTKRTEDPDWTTIPLLSSSSEGGKSHISCSREFLMDALEAGFFRSFSFQDWSSPIVSQDGAGGTHVLMPMRGAELPPGVEEEPVAEPAASEPEEPQPTVPEPQQKEDIMPKTEPESVKNQENALDRALATFEVAKGKLREFQVALSDTANELKAAVRDHRTQAREMEAARAALAKLQAISL